MQVMRIRQRDDRYRKKKKKQQHGSSSHHQAKQLHTEPAYRRKPNPIRRYDTDVLSPVWNQLSVIYHFIVSAIFSYSAVFLNACPTKVFLCPNQSYIQSFRERQVQAQPFPSRMVGGPHAVVDVGYDCGSTTPLTGAAGPSLRV